VTVTVRTAERWKTEAENPMVWYIEVDGLAMDLRPFPIDYQVAP